MTPKEKRAADRRTQRALRADRVAANLCRRCGERPPAPGRTACAICRERDSRNQQDRREYLRSVGLCYDCGNPPAPGYGACAECLQRRADSQRERMRAGRKRCAKTIPFLGGGMNEGKHRCPHIAAPGEKYCWKHGGRRLTPAERRRLTPAERRRLKKGYR